MSRPIGTKVTKDNSRKLPQNHEEWMAGKKIGRPKQRYVYNNGVGWSGIGEGHWEKVASNG